ncbi:MAG: hypothetical protein KDA97_08610 [Acidimicrobiales bacterium]|nr:hypothetical protein [Acidimicrobiales bacterium]
MSTERTVVVPSGRPLIEAAAWVGAACWAELRLVEVLGGWLATEADPERAAHLWRVRADAASRAERWHRHLPELREMPRAAQVAPGAPAVAELFDRLDALGGDPARVAERSGALVAVLRGLRLGYHDHRSVAVGPADGPVAGALSDALRSTFDVIDGEPDPSWTAAVAAAGGLPAPA